MHRFNTSRFGACKRVLKANGTIMVSGTRYVVFSVGYSMLQLGRTWLPWLCLGRLLR
jgi:DNA modification methylase